MKAVNIVCFLIVGVLAGGVAQAADSSDTVFVGDDAPHATLVRLNQKDIRDDVFPVLYVRVDGEPVVGGDSRRYITVASGKHVIRVKPDYAAIQEYQPKSARNMPAPRVNLQEMDITVDAKAGMSYKIAVRRKGTSWTDFTPFVLKSWQTGDMD